MENTSKNKKFQIEVSDQANSVLIGLANDPMVPGNTRKAQTEYIINTACSMNFTELKKYLSKYQINFNHIKPVKS